MHKEVAVAERADHRFVVSGGESCKVLVMASGFALQDTRSTWL